MSKQLDRLHLGYSPKTKNVYIHLPDGRGNALAKKDVTKDFDYIIKDMKYQKQGALTKVEIENKECKLCESTWDDKYTECPNCYCDRYQ